jgi:hypothetical protein
MDVPFFFPGNTSYIKHYNDRDILNDIMSVKYIISNNIQDNILNLIILLIIEVHI